MRILHLVGRSHRRGAELVASELVEALHPAGVEGYLLAVGPGHEGGVEAAIPVLTTSVRQDPMALLRAARALRQELTERPVDVVMAHGGSALQVAALASLGRPVPIVHQLIMGMPVDDRGRVWRAWWRWLLRRCAAIVSLTDELSEEVRRLGYQGPVELVANARDSRRFTDVDQTTAAASIRTLLEIEDHVRLIGFVGHLVDQKRPDVAVGVLARLRSEGLDAHLVVVGGGPNEDALVEQVRRAGVDKHVTLMGHRPDVEVVMSAVEVLVLTSDAEGMPGVAIEAQMAGCPVVSFPVGGVREVVEDMVTGIVLPDHDPSAMAVAVASLLEDEPRRAGMAVAAQRRSERFSMAEAAKTYNKVIEDAVAARREG